MNIQRPLSTWVPVTLSAASGCLWGAIAYVLGHEPLRQNIWAGVAAAPLIGVLAGSASGLLKRRSLPARIGLALVSLYVTAALFALACGVSALATRAPADYAAQLQPVALLVNHVVSVWWGLTVLGYFLVLWPLAFADHELVLQWHPEAAR